MSRKKIRTNNVSLWRNNVQTDEFLLLPLPSILAIIVYSKFISMKTLKKSVTIFTLITLAFASCAKKIPFDEEITIFADKKGVDIVPSMYGVFFEEINHAGDGGLYAELVNNRSFEELEMPKGYHAQSEKLYPKKVPNHLTGEIKNPSYRWTTEPVPAWSLVGDASMTLTKENPKFTSAPNNLKVTIANVTKPVQLINRGYWGMAVKAGEKYHLRTIIRPAANYTGKITAKLLSENGDVIATAEVHVDKNNQWNDSKKTLVPSTTDARAKLALEFESKGTVYIDYVSLFPENTFNGRENGSRADLAEMIAGLKPAFVRWPGGCVVEGITLDNRFEWKKTLGDPAARPGEYSTWGYRCSYGFGYYELLQLCEDLGSEAMFVCNVGIGCQYRMGDASPESEIPYYLDECMDAIEYAIGGIDTEWGAKRAAAGHPEPFPLKYIEIGNENKGAEYEKRFDIFYKAIKAKYPQLVLISNHDLRGIGKIEKTDMIDPHWYETPAFFFNNTTIFDTHPRDKYTVYVGEYACKKEVGSGNMIGALSEAAFITGMERNGDLVTMTSFAPLLENRNDRNWAVNLIWFDTDQVVGRSSYYVQKMFAEHKPDYMVESSQYKGEPKAALLKAGGIGFGAWATQVEYKDVILTDSGRVITPALDQLVSEKGKWTLRDGVLSQRSRETNTKRFLKGFSSNDYTLEFKARKTDGSEGFIIYFGMNNDGSNGFAFNVGGWNNKIATVQEVSRGNADNIVNEVVKFGVETNRWYTIKVDVSPEKAELFVDGELLISYNHKAQPFHYLSSGFDKKTGELILKIVNGENTPYKVKFNLDGMPNVEKIGKVFTLSAIDGKEENSFEEPLKISPVETEYNKFGNLFYYEFQPFSCTILRIKQK